MSRPRSYHLLFVLTLTLISSLFAQQLGELKVVAIPEGEGTTYIVRNPGTAILVVHSTISQLSFENNMGIIRVDNPDPGEYRVHVPPGTNIITFKADGFLPVKERFNIEAKSYREVKILARRASITENRPELILRYNLQSPDERVQGSIDGNILNLDFRKGSVILKPSPGHHVIKLNSNGRAWQKEFLLEEGRTVEEQIVFSEEQTEMALAEEPGSLFITSTPPGAMVYMNELEQGQTPLTLENVTPGRYEIDVVRPLYIPEHFVIDIIPLMYTTHTVNLTSNFGKLRIDSEPAGASVYLDGEEKGRTPLNLSQLNAGTHHLKLLRSLYHDEETEVVIASGDSISQQFTLNPKFGSLKISSAPEGAVVFLDGMEYGVSPLAFDTVRSGEHVLTIKHEHFHEWVDQVRIEDGRELTRHYNLKGDFGLLSVITDPPGASVTFSGENIPAQTTPAEDIMLDPGTYMIRVEKDQHETFETTVMVALGANERVETVLERRTGTLKISSKPQLASIYLDGELMGQTPTVLKDVPTGFHRLRLEMEGFDVQEDRIYIERRKISNIHSELSTIGYKAWELRRNRARVLALAAPGGGQFLSGQYWRGGIYSTFFALSLINAINARVEYNDHKDNYTAKLEAYNANEDEQQISSQFNDLSLARDDVIKSKDAVNSFLILAGGIYLAQTIDAWIWGGGAKPHYRPNLIKRSKKLGFQPYMDSKNGNLRAGLFISFGGGK